MAQATALSNKYKSMVREGMKVTKSSLKDIIEEELQKLLEWPDWGGVDPHFDEDEEWEAQQGE